MVKADGTVHDFAMFEPDEMMSSTCRERYQKYSLAAIYVPAFHDGIAVDSVHLRLLWPSLYIRPNSWPIVMPTFDTDSEY